MITDDDLRQLAILSAKFVLEANENGHSMVSVELDPKKLFGIPGRPSDGAGKMLIAIAAGPSIDTLASAMLLAQNPH